MIKLTTKAQQEKALAEALAMLAANNIDVSEMPQAVETDYRSNDAVAVFASWPDHFKPNVCRNCGKTFAVNKKSVGFCSDLCRREDWRKTTGLEWNRISTHDVWDGDPPMIITPSQYDNLKRIAEWFSRNQAEIESRLAQETAQERQEREEQEYWETLTLSDPEDQTPIPTPTVVRDLPATFDIFEPQQEDQGEPHTNPDSWIFG